MKVKGETCGVEIRSGFALRLRRSSRLDMVSVAPMTSIFLFATLQRPPLFVAAASKAKYG
jgi:hypothetical protein